MGNWDDVEPEKNGHEDDDTPRAPATRSQTVRMNENAIMDLTHRMAALTVRRTCNQADHQCRPSAGLCRHRNHRRDAALLLPEMLEMLGLSADVPEVSVEDKKNWLSGLRNAPAISLNDLDEK